MRTVPTIITDYGREGAPLIFILDIDPSAADSWSTKRFSEAAVTVDGNAYTETMVKEVTRISQSAKIENGGNIGVFPDVNVELIDKDKLHEEFITDRITNRKATLKLTAIGPNRILNSSFENGIPFDNWTSFVAPGGSILHSTVHHYDGSRSCYIKGGTTDESYIRSDTFRIYRGEPISLSLYVKQHITPRDIGLVFKFDNMWWADIISNWSVSRYVNWIGQSSATWQRLSMTLDWSDWTGSTAKYKDCYIEIVAKSAEDFYVDAVQVEGRAISPYHHNRYELVDDDCLPVFIGSIKKPSWKNSRIKFSLDAWTWGSHRKIPSEIITDDTVSGWQVPKNSKGKPFPMTYGDFNSDELTVWNPHDSGLEEFARGILANMDPGHADKIVVYFDRPSMKIYKPGGGIFRLYHFCEDDGRYYEQMYNDDTGYSYDSREFIEDFANHPRWKMDSNTYWLPMLKSPFMAALKSSKTHFETPGEWTNTYRILDGNLETLGYTSCGLAAYRAVLESFPFNPNNIIRDADNNVSIYILGDFMVTGSNSDLVSILHSIEDYITGCDYQDIWNNISAPYAWGNTPTKRSIFTPPANKKLTEIKFNITSWNSFVTIFPIVVMGIIFFVPSPGSSSLYVYEMGALIYFTLPLEETAYAGQLFGRTFGTTWGGRKTATNMVNSAPEIIESIIREELGAVDADIKDSLFDAADTARSIAAAGQLHELKDSKSVIKKICQEFGLLYFDNFYGKHALLNLDYKTSIDTLRMRDFKEPRKNLDISITPRESVINSVKLWYDKNQFTGEYEKFAYCNKDGYSGTIGASYQTKCSDSYAEIGNVEQFYEIECDWIKNNATAEAMVKWIIDWRSLQRYVVKGEVFVENIKLEVGDVISLDIEPMLPRSVTDVSRFFIMDTGLKKSRGLIGVTLLEVKAA